MIACLRSWAEKEKELENQRPCWIRFVLAFVYGCFAFDLLGRKTFVSALPSTRVYMRLMFQVSDGIKSKELGESLKMHSHNTDQADVTYQF